MEPVGGVESAGGEGKVSAGLMKRLVLAALATAVVVTGVVGCAWAPEQKAPAGPAKVGAVKVNAHPASLDGKTVVLRWNGKPNGDKLLTRVSELLTEKYKDIRVIRLWETAPETAAISKSQEESEKLAAKIAELKPDLVIASQAD